MLWLLALAVGFFAPLVVRPSGWRLHPAHFIERHGLIVIIAIGESLAAIGLGARRGGLGTEEIVAAVLGFAVAASFWLAYFDFFTIRAQQLLDDRSGVQQIALARDTYTYLHLPMVVGVMLFAFAVKTTLAHVHAELSIVHALALCGGRRRSICSPTSDSAFESRARSAAAGWSQLSSAPRSFRRRSRCTRSSLWHW